MSSGGPALLEFLTKEEMPFHGTLPAHHERYPDLSSRLARSDPLCGKALRGLPWFCMTMNNARISWGRAKSNLKTGG